MSESPGWDAIDDVLRPVYGDREPKHFGTIIRYSLGGPDPLDGLSAYPRDDHWHFVTYGFTELYTKESADPKVSGYGFELTFRLARKPSEENPPMWALNLLQNLGRYVFGSGNGFDAGHHMTLNGPIALGEDTDITAVLFVADPELRATSSSHGSFSFVQLVGITADELEAIQGWNSLGFSKLLAANNPLWITDLRRKSILEEAAIARQVAEGTERDGSSMGELFVSTARWNRDGRRVRFTIDALSAGGLRRQLRGRLLHQRGLLVQGKGGEATNLVAFKPAERSSVEVAGSGYLVVGLSPKAAAAMSAELRPERGSYRCSELPDFELEVVPTEIKDGQGKVIRVVG